MFVDDVDGAAEALLEGDVFAHGEDKATVPQSDTNGDFVDETELPSETAVFADVQRNIDVQTDESAQTGLERAGSSSSISVDLHQEIAELPSHP